MAKAPFQINGVDALVDGLKANANLNDVKRVVRLNGTELQRRAMRNAPVDTGTLKRAIKLTMQDNGFTARVSANTDYAGYVEFGTRYIYPRYYMRNSLRYQRRQFLSDMSRLINGR